MVNIFANGKTGVIGSKLPHYVLEVDFRLEDCASDIEIIKSRLKSESIFIHLAGLVGKSKVEDNPDESEYINVTATRILGEISQENDLAKFVYISSSHVYGFSQEPRNESSSLNPTSLYAEQKLRAEEELLSIFKDQPSRLLIIRLFSVLDIGMPVYSLPGRVEQALSKNQRVNVANSEDIRTFMRREQAANQITKLALDDRVFGIYNLSTQNPLSVRDAILKLFEKEPIEKVEFIQGKSDNPKLVADLSKLRAILPNYNEMWK
jgi:UDP-glucose 4-epimerase/GDP-4-dehydro-6-deoxy-D-mannose reductase